MKKLILILVTITLIIPNFVFASWWNPLTWFIGPKWQIEDYNSKMNDKEISNQENQIQKDNLIATTSIISTFYVKYDNARVRKCPSTDCEIVGYLKINTDMTVEDNRIYKLSDLPEWMDHTNPAGFKGYVNKSILSDKPITNDIISKLQKKETYTNLNFNSIPISSIDLLIKQTKEDIKYTEELIHNVDQAIKDTTERKDFVKNSNIYNDSRFNALVKWDEENIEWYEKYIAHFNQYLDTMKSNLSIFQQNKEKIITYDYKNEDVARKEAQQILNESKKESEFSEQLVKDGEDYYKKHSIYESTYKNSLSILRNNIEANKPSSATYIPTPIYVPPIIPSLNVPHMYTCSISPIGGWGVNLVSTCY